MSQLFFSHRGVKSYSAYKRIVARLKLNVKMLVINLFCQKSIRALHKCYYRFYTQKDFRQNFTRLRGQKSSVLENNYIQFSSDPTIRFS